MKPVDARRNPAGTPTWKVAHPAWTIAFCVFAFAFFGSAGLFGKGNAEDPALSGALGLVCLILAGLSALWQPGWRVRRRWDAADHAPPDAPQSSPTADPQSTEDAPWGARPAVQPLPPQPSSWPRQYTPRTSRSEIPRPTDDAASGAKPVAQPLPPQRPSWPPQYRPPRPAAPPTESPWKWQLTPAPSPAPKTGERCPMETSASGAPKAIFEDEADARRFMEKNRHRYQFDHAYKCPHFNHWHVSSKQRL